MEYTEQHNLLIHLFARTQAEDNKGFGTQAEGIRKRKNCSEEAPNHLPVFHGVKVVVEFAS